MKKKEKCECNDKCEEKCECNDNCGCACDESCTCGCSDGSNDKLIENLTKQIEELTNNLLMSKADFVNYRKRLEDERIRDFKYCNEDLILEILPIVDNFERAIKLDDIESDELSKFLEGFKMIYCNLLNILKKYGVIEIDGFNKPFNPTYHQAVLTEKVDGVESGYVVEVLQKGYILKDKVIRPAMVKVSE